MISAIEFGRIHRSCAMDWRRSLGPGATQSDAWLACENGSHLIWQLQCLSDDELSVIVPPLLRAIDVIVSRAADKAKEAKATSEDFWTVNCAANWVTDATNCQRRAAAKTASAADVLYWADWISYAAYMVYYITASSADADKAKDAELNRQAEDIRATIPEWPGE